MSRLADTVARECSDLAGTLDIAKSEEPKSDQMPERRGNHEWERTNNRGTGQRDSQRPRIARTSTIRTAGRGSGTQAT